MLIKVDPAQIKIGDKVQILNDGSLIENEALITNIKNCDVSNCWRSHNCKRIKFYANKLAPTIAHRCASEHRTFYLWSNITINKIMEV